MWPLGELQRISDTHTHTVLYNYLHTLLHEMLIINIRKRMHVRLPSSANQTSTDEKKQYLQIKTHTNDNGGRIFHAHLAKNTNWLR